MLNRTPSRLLNLTNQIFLVSLIERTKNNNTILQILRRRAKIRTANWYNKL